MKLNRKNTLIAVVILFLLVIAGRGRDKQKTWDKVNTTDNNSAAGDFGQTGGQGGNSAIIIGIEYAVEGQDPKVFAALGIDAIKPLPETINWSKMQIKVPGPIDFTVADKFVREYQRAGFKDIVLGLRTLSHKDDNRATYGKNRPVPKPEYADDYATWIKAMVERYDKDGGDDMPGLVYPVRYYEIEVEFSSYTPEGVDDYLEKLKTAYQAAHQAYADVLIAHSAFLAATAFDADPKPNEYDKAFGEMKIPDKHHNLADMRKVLDHPELFDRVNFHELTEPIMIERTVKWLKFEMNKRGYVKPIIISDTAPSPFVSYGRGTSCTGPFLGIIVWPAQEKDRCRLADYFNNILDNDQETLVWKNLFVAADMVKKTIIAAQQGVELINTAFTGDLPILNSRLGFAGAGNAGFAGVLSQRSEYRPGFYALKQAAEKMKGVSKVSREATDPDVRLYRVESGDKKFWIGWLQPNYLVLPEDHQPVKSIDLPFEGKGEITDMAITGATSRPREVNDKQQITLGIIPIYIEYAL